MYMNSEILLETLFIIRFNLSKSKCKFTKERQSIRKNIEQEPAVGYFEFITCNGLGILRSLYTYSFLGEFGL